MAIGAAKVRKIQAELSAAVAKVLAENGMKVDGAVDVRQFIGVEKGRVMAFNFVPGSGVVPVIQLATTPVVKKTKPRKGSTLETAMKHYGIANKTNAKGDRIIEYKPRRHQYPFVYVSVRGARWKLSVEEALRRFG